MSYDFGGYATRNDLLCADGRTIRKDAFIENDGETVPLVWQHQHNEPTNILGHAVLENRDDGVYAYCTFNDTEAGRNAKELVRHGDITKLSIYANQLKQKGGNVLHGSIREVSLVLAGANPGACIDFLSLEHSFDDDYENEAIIHTGLDFQLAHAYEEESGMGDRTVGDVFNEMTDEQKNVVYFMIGQALQNAGITEEDSNMKHNAFDGDMPANTLTHGDMSAILENAKRVGSLRGAMTDYFGDPDVIVHSIDTTDMEVPTGTNPGYGVYDPAWLFPEYRNLTTTPEFIKRNTDWVAKVMNGAHHTPFSRIKTMFADITEDEARARGYMKGKLKKEEVFTLLKRTTDPQTIYKKQKMDRDDIVDITDFDVVSWIRGEMRIMLNEEIARAILIGDGRLPDSNDKIQESHIRPIYNDAPLFTIQAPVETAANATEQDKANAFIEAAIRARKNYKGSGNPTLFTTEDMLTSMLLIKDLNQRFIYESQEKLANTLRVKDIVTVEVMEGLKNTNGKDVLGIIVNMADYNIGADKGGQINSFEDFDIDYNQQKYLIETRCSGALVKPFSAITLYHTVKE